LSLPAPRRGPRREATVDLAALHRNIRALSTGTSDPLLDLRASAYGHGLVAVARAVRSEFGDDFAARVSTLAEAVELRDAGVTSELLAPAAGGDRSLAESRGIRLIETTSEAEDAAAARDLGAGVYGLSPDVEHLTAAVMTLCAEVVATKAVTAGTGVSYGYTYRAPTDTTIALVSIGYADGVPRLGSNTAFAALGGEVFPVVGRIAMDQLVLDIGHTDASPGDTVTLFGDARGDLPTAIEWAGHARRSPLAVTTSLGRRVRRVYTRGPQ
jgi:alanine racemase